MTKAEQARHKLLVEQLKSRRARGETDIIIRGDNIIIRSRSQRQQTEKQNSRSGSLEVMDCDNASMQYPYQTTIDPDLLCGPQVIQTIIKIPDYVFLNKYYYLLCSSILC